jgi:signal transduction histidine kinase
LLLEGFLHKNSISCFLLQTDNGLAVDRGNDSCRAENILADVQRQTRTKQDTTVVYHGTTWAVFTFSHKRVLVGRPLFDTSGEVAGTVIAGASLEPVYAGIRRQGRVVLFYILINTIIFAGIGLLRMMQLVIKPIERCTSRVRQYTPASGLDFFPEAANNEFATLSGSLNNLFGRIREDNARLRTTVTLLEAANRELEHNKKEMVRTEKLAAIGRLSAGLAHEIGNPLGIIQGYVELLGRDDISSKERQQFSGNSQHELDRIKMLIRRLLDFARPVEWSVQPVAVNELIRQVVGFVGMEKGFAHCTITEKLDAAADVVIADGDSLRQVLLNCLLNAADSLDAPQVDGEITVTTANPASEPANPLLLITIQDNGRGIGDEHLENVFDPFFTTKGPGQGTGLGLFVCHTIIDRLGGSIAIRNRRPGGVGGAEVLITLPVAGPRQPSTFSL